MTERPFDHGDGMVQHAVLTHVLVEHPIIFTASELVSELAIDPDDFNQRDTVERAIRDLVKVRLLYRYGPFVLPTRAAAYFSSLWDAYE